MLKRWIYSIQKLWEENTVTIYDPCRFENILVPQDNGNQSQNDSYTTKYQKHVVCS